MAKVNLSGHYLKSGPKIILDKASALVIKERKKPDLLKTQNYLVFEHKGKQGYCSSLYPTDKENTYNIDYQGFKYTVTFSDSQASIKARGVHQ